MAFSPPKPKQQAGCRPCSVNRGKRTDGRTEAILGRATIADKKVSLPYSFSVTEGSSKQRDRSHLSV